MGDVLVPVRGLALRKAGRVGRISTRRVGRSGGVGSVSLELNVVVVGCYYVCDHVLNCGDLELDTCCF